MEPALLDIADAGVLPDNQPAAPEGDEKVTMPIDGPILEKKTWVRSMRMKSQVVQMMTRLESSFPFLLNAVVKNNTLIYIAIHIM